MIAKLKKANPQTRKSLISNLTAKTVIWIFTILTMLILAWIVGYILYKGFYRENYPEYKVTPITEHSIPLERYYGGTGESGKTREKEELVLIVQNQVRIRDITIYDLQKLYNKRRRENWGFYTAQDIKSQVFAYAKSAVNTNFERGAQNLLIPEMDEYKSYTIMAVSPEEMIQRVGTTPGGLGFIPKEYSENLPKEVKVLPVRRFSLAVNPEVTALENNQSLTSLDASEMSALLRGEIKNWSTLGGRDLPVTPVLPPAGSPEHQTVTRFLDQSGHSEPITTQAAASRQNQMNALENILGSVTLLPYNEAKQVGVEIIPIVRKEAGRNLSLSFILEAPARSGQWGGISTIIINTLVLILFTLLFSAPLGIGAAVFLVEYAKQGFVIRLIRIGTETLAGIPSIIFGLFGFIFFVDILHMGIGFLSATLTVTLMILPTIIRTSEEALKSVPQSYRDGSLALGATKLQTIFKVVLPAASPGILTGVILAIGRTVGETAVLLYTLGSSMDLVRSASSSSRVLSLHLYLLFAEALSFDNAFATGTILIIIILLVNFSATALISRMNRMAGRR